MPHLPVLNMPLEREVLVAATMTTTPTVAMATRARMLAMVAWLQATMAMEEVDVALRAMGAMVVTTMVTTPVVAMATRVRMLATVAKLQATMAMEAIAVQCDQCGNSVPVLQ